MTIRPIRVREETTVPPRAWKGKPLQDERLLGRFHARKAVFFV
ncbi:hypothetical protein SAMN05660235_03020 [Sporolituus thermophilus DSM 23256]|uniref:Uncharacterized protein n=1 Tax=Sporolituus thermophilus DSM 23256 TaxID=1123285 RepID=A0A1G7PRN5_9FIRM|nr:hypothetical protein SAMN05660235_03020 [Sporolituus thermophilus DSM 23256]